MHCRICGNKSDENRLCNKCKYFLDNRTSEEALRRMYSDDKTKKVWEENKNIAEDLADAYYEHILQQYESKYKKDSKENFGYNTFADGISLALDIIMPMIDKEVQDQIKEKIKLMVKKRQEINERTNRQNQYIFQNFYIYLSIL